MVLQKLSSEFRKIFTHDVPMGMGIYIVRDGKFVFISPRLSESFGYAEAELIGNDTLGFVHPEDREKTRTNAVEMLKGERLAPYEFRFMTKNGGIKWFMGTVTSSLVGEKREVLGYCIDISDAKRAEEALRESEERYRTIIENIEDGYYELDADGRFTFFNESCRKIFGYASDELTGMNCRDCTKKKSWENVGKVFDMVVDTLKPDRVHDWVIVRKDGHTRHIEASLAPIRGMNGNAKGVRGIMRDVTKRKKAEQTLTFMAYHDTLTGLPNRVLFDDRLSFVLVQSRRNKQKFAVAMLDIDYFKEINDTLGHHIGDKLLKGVGDRLQELVRKGDTVARMGGDEFMILFPDVKQIDNGLALAKKIVESLREPFYIGEHKLSITASVGIAVYPDDGMDFETLKNRADASMYKVKESGRNNFQRYVP